jgi:hypothetical protein
MDSSSFAEILAFSLSNINIVAIAKNDLTVFGLSTLLFFYSTPSGKD